MLLACVLISGIVYIFIAHSVQVNIILGRFGVSTLFSNRINVYKETMELIFQHLLFGRSAYSYHVFDAVKAHNWLLESLVQTGLIGTAVYGYGPIQNIKAGIGDTISNYMALLDWEFAVSRGKDEMNGYAYLMSRNSLDALMKTQYDRICPEFIEVLVNSLVLSGIAMDFAGSSRPVSGSEHLFSHALDFYSEKKNLHGLQVALGTVAVLKLIGHPQNEVVDYLKRFDVNVNPLAMGIDEDTFVLCMQKATTMRKNRYTYLHEIDLSTDRVKNVYKELVKEL